jgi:hypothetical protein
LIGLSIDYHRLPVARGYPGHITTGSIAEFLIYVNLLSPGSRRPLAGLPCWCNEPSSQARINERPWTRKTDIVSRRMWNDIKGAYIVFDHVSFTYPDTSIQVLRDVCSASGRARRWPLSATPALAKVLRCCSRAF